MADSTTNLDQVLTSQAAKEVVVNALFDASSPASYWGRQASTTNGLIWGYYGGVALTAGNVPTRVANGTLTLTASNTNYIWLDQTPSVQHSTTAPTGWPGPMTGKTALYSVVAGATSVTSYLDFRI